MAGNGKLSGLDDFEARLQALLNHQRSDETSAATDETPETTNPTPPNDPQDAGAPVGQGGYVVRPGDCVASIANEHGHFWETIWNEPANAELKQLRQDPNVLLPGDRVTIPEKERKEEPGQTEMRHRFLRKGEPVNFHLRLMRNDQPRANLPYTLKLDSGQEIAGTTDSGGCLQCQIPGNAAKGKLTIHDGNKQVTYDLHLGHLDPLDDLRGVRQRLRNLGYYAGPVDQAPSEMTTAAIRTFQKANGLDATGKLDQTTRDALRKEAGS